jgi:hypothetical protein
VVGWFSECGVGWVGEVMLSKDICRQCVDKYRGNYVIPYGWSEEDDRYWEIDGHIWCPCPSGGTIEVNGKIPEECWYNLEHEAKRSDRIHKGI